MGIRNKKSRELYKVLGLTSDATERDIRRAYCRLSIQLHPDKCTRLSQEDQENAKVRFREVCDAYTILGNLEYRKQYDETGRIPSEDSEDWKAWTKSMTARVTLDALEKMKDEYQGSEDERKDLGDLYVKFKGNFNMIINELLFYDVEDERRYLKIIRQEIKTQGLERYKKFNKTIRDRTKRVKTARSEEKEAEKLRDKLGIKGESDLIHKIRARNENRRFIPDNLIQKYIISPDPLSDDEFKQIQTKLFKSASK
jgi:DnaJ homolog subfamily C member 9